MGKPVNFRVYNTAKFRQGYRSEDWQNRVAPPEQADRYANRHSSELPEDIRVIEFDLNECLAQDSQLDNFESSPMVKLRLEYYNGQRWIVPKGEGNQIEFDPKDFGGTIDAASFSITRMQNTIRVELPAPLRDAIDKYRLQITLEQTFPDKETTVQ